MTQARPSPAPPKPPPWPGRPALPRRRRRPAQLTTAEQAACLHDLERITRSPPRPRPRPGRFTASRGYTEDADYSPGPGSSTKPASPRAPRPGTPRGSAGPRPPPITRHGRRRADGVLRRTLCGWTDRLRGRPRHRRHDPGRGRGPRDDLRDLAMLAAEIASRACPPDDDRARVSRTGGPAGDHLKAPALVGDLTPECAALVGTVLDALSAPAARRMTGSHAQRYHDALAEAMHRLVSAGCCRAGRQPPSPAHISLPT